MRPNEPARAEGRRAGGEAQRLAHGARSQKDEMGAAAPGGRISFREFAEWWARGGDDVDSKFMKWWFKDAVSRSFKMRKKAGHVVADCAHD